ncbi:MAG: hypothetical protein J0M12_01605 [Deltaproteobacteria bacterium]|nr:hypothetical protein [Deltaproteobacteria bacterium]
MGRPVYTYELSDPDLSWLVSNFQENNPNYILVENSCLPVSFFKGSDAPAQTENFPVLVKADALKTAPVTENK